MTPSGIGCAGADGVAVEHALGLGVADELGAQPRLLLAELDEMVAAIAPGFAAVGRAHHAGDFEHGVDLVGMAGARREPHDAAVERHLGVDRQVEVRRAGPGLAAVGAAIDRDGGAAGQHALGIGRIDHERPHLHLLVGKIRALEGGAMVGRAIDAVGGAGEDEARIARMHEHGEGFEVLQHVVPVGGRRRRGGTRRPCRFCPWSRNSRRRRRTRMTEPWRSPPGFWAMIWGWMRGRKGTGAPINEKSAGFRRPEARSSRSAPRARRRLRRARRRWPWRSNCWSRA